MREFIDLALLMIPQYMNDDDRYRIVYRIERDNIHMHMRGSNVASVVLGHVVNDQCSNKDNHQHVQKTFGCLT